MPSIRHGDGDREPTVEPLRAYLQRILRTTAPGEAIHRIAVRLLRRLESDSLTVADIDAAARELQRAGAFYRLCDLVEVTLGCPAVLLDTAWTAPLQRRRGVALMRRGRGHDAIDAIESAIDAYRAEHDAEGLSRAQSDLGTVYGTLYRWPECRHALRLAVIWAQESGNEWLVAMTEFNGAISAHKVGRWRETLATLIRIRPYMQTIDALLDDAPAAEGRRTERREAVDPAVADAAQFVTNYLVEVAQAFRHLRFARAAVRVASRAERVSREFDVPRGHILALGVLGEAQLDLGKIRRAHSIFSQARREALEIAPEGDLAVSAFRQLAEVNLALGEFEPARRVVKSGLLHAEKLTDHTEWIRLVRVDARLHIEQGRHRQGVERVREAIARAREQGLDFEEAIGLEFLGLHHTEHGTPREAERYLAASRRIYRALGIERHRRALAAGRRVASVVSPEYDLPGLIGIHTVVPSYRAALEERLAHLLDGSEQVLVVQGEPGSGKEHVVERLHDAVRPGSRPVRIGPGTSDRGRGPGEGTSDLGQVIRGARGGSVFLFDIEALDVDRAARIAEELCPLLAAGHSAPLVLATTSHEIDRPGAVEVVPAALREILGTARLTIPPLRSRRLDIVYLANAILDEIFAGEVGLPPGLSSHAVECLVNFRWPDNVRQLRDTLQFAILSSEGRGTIERDDLPPTVRGARPRRGPSGGGGRVEGRSADDETGPRQGGPGAPFVGDEPY